MKKIFSCRRTFISTLSILLLFVLGYFQAIEVTTAIVTICLGLYTANASEAVLKKNSNSDQSK